VSDFDLVIRGRVVDMELDREDGWVAVRDGRVALLGTGAPPAAPQSHDFRGCLVLPGAIDSQVHSRSQRGQEDFLWSTRAAAAGGVTTVVDMPYDDGDLICTAQRLRAKADSAALQARVDFALWGTVHPQHGAREIAAMAAAGAAAFKFSTFGTDPERFPRIPPKLMLECFQAIAPTGLVAGVHNEDEETVRAYLAQVEAASIRDYRAHGLSRPPISELLATAQIYELGAASGCPAHVVHCSLARGYALCSAYRDQGYPATMECPIHYLTLDEENDVRRLGGVAKINPPIRPRQEVESLWEQLAQGQVSVVSTDHVSWSLERKNNPEMLKNASGVPGLEVMVSLLLHGLTQRSLPYTWAARLLAGHPARLFRLGGQKGALEPGCEADVAVFKPGAWRYDPGASGHNVVHWSPYAGMTLSHRPEATFLRGEPVFAAESAIAAPGTGRWVRP
jgi:allantoinase